MEYGGTNKSVVNPDLKKSMIFTNVIHAQAKVGDNSIMPKT
jgi:hypothetical protein